MPSMVPWLAFFALRAPLGAMLKMLLESRKLVCATALAPPTPHGTLRFKGTFRVGQVLLSNANFD